MERSTRARLVSMAVLMLVFGTGFLIGVAWDRSRAAPGTDVVAEEDVEPAVAGDEHDDEDRRRRGRRDRRLIVHGVSGLTVAQEMQVEAIVDRHSRTLGSLRRELEESFDSGATEVLMSTRNAIRAVLTESQTEAYDSLLASHDRRRAEAEERKRDGK